MSNLYSERPITVRLPNGPEPTFTGRDARTLRLLLATGLKGFTAGEANPPGLAYRWPVSIQRLRRRGVPIETIREGKSRQGRYRLSGPVKVVKGGDDDA